MGNQKSSSLPPQLVEELEGMTSFNYAEVNDLYRQFRNDCPDGKMKVDQFKKLYRDTFPDGNPEKFAELVFGTFDKEHKGSLDFRQFVTTLSAQLKGTFDEKLEWLFSLYDTDHTGYISRTNLLEMITAIYELQIGALPSEEQLSPEEVTNHIMKHAQGTRPNSIKKEEFVQAAMTSNTFAAILQSTIKAADSPYLRRKERRGSLGIALHPDKRVEQLAHLQDLEGTRRPSDTGSSGSGGKAANPSLLTVGATETRRPSLTPDMLDFGSIGKK